MDSTGNFRDRTFLFGNLVRRCLHKDGDGYVSSSIGEGNDADTISSFRLGGFQPYGRLQCLSVVAPLGGFCRLIERRALIKLQILWRANKRFDKVTKNWVSSKAKSQLNLSQMA